MYKSIIAIIKAYFISVLAGFLSIPIVLLLFSDYGQRDGIVLLIRTIANFFIAFLLCLIVFLPIAVFDKEEINKRSTAALARRYLPIITLPLAILFCIILLAGSDGSDRYFFLTGILTTFCLSYAGLWAFLKKIKS